MDAEPLKQQQADRGSPVFTRRDLVIGCTLGAAALVSELVAPRADPDKLRRGRSLEDLVPNAIGQRTRASVNAILIPRGEDAQDKSYDQVLTRYYTGGSAAPIMLLIAYGSAQVGNTEMHRPEVCYPAAGFRLRDWPDVPLQFLGATISARSLTALASGRIEQILYWSRVGVSFPTSSLGQRWAALRATMRGSVPDGVLVRISTIDPDRERALPVLSEFAGALLDAGGAELRMLLTGRR
jgi:EpsI family protein